VAPVPLILDVDTGIDDALALLYALASPEVELIGATAVSGNVSAHRAAENTRAVLSLAAADRVEVARGPTAPPAHDRDSATRHGPQGIGNAVLPAPLQRAGSRRAARLIADEARRRPGDVMLVATGPLSNVAAALVLEPELPTLLRSLAIGGGAYGPAARDAETNMRIDPDAARAVFAAFTDAPVLPTCVGLDESERARITRRDLVQLRSSRGDDAIMRFVDDATSFAIDRYARERGFDGAPMHDPLALAIAIDEDLGNLQPARVEVGLDGHTVAETDGVHANARVARAVDVDRFMARFLERIGSLPTRPRRPR
jgi:purine nucleosidase